MPKLSKQTERLLSSVIRRLSAFLDSRSRFPLSIEHDLSLLEVFLPPSWQRHIKSVSAQFQEAKKLLKDAEHSAPTMLPYYNLVTDQQLDDYSAVLNSGFGIPQEQKAARKEQQRLRKRLLRNEV